MVVFLDDDHIHKMFYYLKKKYQSDCYISEPLFTWYYLYGFFTEHCNSNIEIFLDKESNRIKNNKVVILPIICDLTQEYYEFTADIHKNSSSMLIGDELIEKKLIRHWMIAIINTEKQTVELYDSLNNSSLLSMWSNILQSWLEWKLEKIFKITSFSKTMRHQNNDTHCGYYIILYFHLHLQGYSIHDIENFGFMNDQFISNNYGPKILEKFGSYP